MSTSQLRPTDHHRALPREFWPLNIADFLPEAPQFPPLATSDFPDTPDDQYAAAAIIRATDLLEARFLTDVSTMGVLSRLTWSRTLAGVLTSILTSLRTTRSSEDSPFEGLTTPEREALQRARTVTHTLHSFLNRPTEDLEYFTDEELCLKCLGDIDIETDKSRIAATLLSCGNDVHATRLTEFNARRREVVTEINKWSLTALAEAKHAIIASIICKDAPLVTHEEVGLRDWIDSQADRLRRGAIEIVANEAISDTLEAWYTMRVQEVQQSLSERFDAKRDSLNQDAAIALTQAKDTIAAAHHQAKVDAIEAADQDFAKFKHELKIEMEGKKDRARKAAESGLRAANRGNTSHPALSRASSRHRTPRPKPSALPSPTTLVPSSQTPPDLASPTPLALLSPVVGIAPPHIEPEREKTPTPRPVAPALPSTTDPILLAIQHMSDRFSARFDEVETRLRSVETKEDTGASESGSQPSYDPATREWSYPTVDDGTTGCWHRPADLEHMMDPEDFVPSILEARARDHLDVWGDDPTATTALDVQRQSFYGAAFDVIIPSTDTLHVTLETAIYNFGELYHADCLECNVPCSYDLCITSPDDIRAFLSRAGSLPLRPLRPCPEWFPADQTSPPEQRLITYGRDNAYRTSRPTGVIPTSRPNPAPGSSIAPIHVSSSSPSPPPISTARPIRPPERAQPIRPPGKYDWISVTKKKPSFTDKAKATPANPAQRRQPSPNPAPHADAPDPDTRRHLMQATEPEIRALWKQRFGKPVPSQFKSKSAVVKAYIIGKTPSPQPSRPAARPLHLRNAEWTVTKGNRFDRTNLDPASQIVRKIQQNLQRVSNGQEPHLNLLGGRWSSNDITRSVNFVLIFAGHPDPAKVM
jgi:hypothetical protein